MCPNQRDIIFEHVHAGNVVKIVAVDVATGIEVSSLGSPMASRQDLEALAHRKLMMVLKKRDIL